MAGTPYSKETQTGRVWTCPKADPDCTRKVPCHSCLGRRNRRKGKVKQREARKALGIAPPRAGMAANEEEWRDSRLRWEVKSGMQVKSLCARFLAAELQSDRAKAIGDPRPFAFVAMGPGMGSEGVVAVRLSVWKTLFPEEAA